MALNETLAKGSVMNMISFGGNFNSPVTMSSRDIAALCKKLHKHVLRDIENMMEQINGSKLGLVDLEAQYQDAKGEWRKEYCLPEDLVVTLITGYRADLRYKVVKELERMRKDRAAGALPDFSNPVAAARAWADAQEARMIAEQTKAEIGSRREATAMNTASQAVKKVKRLEKELDRSLQYATVKRMEGVYRGKGFNWRHLKKAAEEMGLPSIDIFDANYGSVKAYHADVWRKVYAVDVRGVLQ